MKLFVIFSYQARLGIFFKISGVIIGINHFYGLRDPVTYTDLIVLILMKLVTCMADFVTKIQIFQVFLVKKFISSQ